MNKFKNPRKSRKNRRSKRIYGKGNIISSSSSEKKTETNTNKGVGILDRLFRNSNSDLEVGLQLPYEENISHESISSSDIAEDDEIKEYYDKNININGLRHQGLRRIPSMSPRSWVYNRSPISDIESRGPPFDDDYLYIGDDPNETSYNFSNGKQTDRDGKTTYYHPGKYPEDMSQKELNSKKAQEIMGNKFGGKKRRKRKTKRKNKKKRKTRKNSHLGWFH